MNKGESLISLNQAAAIGFYYGRQAVAGRLVNIRLERVSSYYRVLYFVYDNEGNETDLLVADMFGLSLDETEINVHMDAHYLLRVQLNMIHGSKFAF